MLKYIVRRVLIFIPTLFAISLIAFVISISAPGDPIENLFEGAKGESGGSAMNENVAREKDALRHKLGLDLPVFYFTMTTLAEPDTFYRVKDKMERETLSRMLDRFGNWTEIEAWHESLGRLRKQARIEVTPDSAFLSVFPGDSVSYLADQFKQKCISLLRTDDPIEVHAKLNTLEQEIARFDKYGSGNFLTHCKAAVADCKTKFAAVESGSSNWKNYIPALHFYGYNQYHRWLFGDGNWITGSGSEHCHGVIRGDFGISYASRKPVTETIARALPWSMLFTVISVILAYLISIPVGIQAAAKRGSAFDKTSSVVLFMLYSLPTFFMGTLLVMTFANPDSLAIFPATGIKPATGYLPDASWWDKFMATLPYMILPLICYTYASLAFLSRTMR
ncbi:MAG TPA: hypothetical protein VK826_15105, partial [Bacteroidia bacterium]|nr:hypothetical protein [Bacteroidia bacterium]